MWLQPSPQEYGAVLGSVAATWDMGCVPLGPGASRTVCRLWLGWTGARLLGIFRIYTWTKFGGFISRGSWTVAKWGWSQFMDSELKSVCLLPGAWMGVILPRFLEIWGRPKAKWDCSWVLRDTELFWTTVGGSAVWVWAYLLKNDTPWS